MRISPSFHHDSRRGNLSSDTARETIRKISFKPTSRRSSQPRQAGTCPPGTRRATKPTASCGAYAQVAQVFGTHRHKFYNPDMSTLASSAASSADWVARWIAIAGVIVSLGSICVTVYQWQRSGWFLDVTVNTQGNFTVEITNTGRIPCVIHEVGLECGPVQLVERILQSWGPTITRGRIPSEKTQRTLAPSDNLTVEFDDYQTIFAFPPFRCRGRVRTGKHEFMSHWSEGQYANHRDNSGRAADAANEVTNPGTAAE